MTIPEQIEKIILPVAEKENVEIVDIEYVSESGQKILRIYIDYPNGVNLDLCTKMSHLFGTEIDKNDPITEHYVLEISSPGIDRILKKEKDFLRFKGFNVKVTTLAAINNQKHFKGTLVAVANNKIVVDDVTNKIVEIEIKNILRAQVITEN